MTKKMNNVLLATGTVLVVVALLFTLLVLTTLVFPVGELTPLLNALVGYLLGYYGYLFYDENRRS